MSKSHRIEKTDVCEVLWAFFDTIKDLKTSDLRDGTHKSENFINAVAEVYWTDSYKSGYDMLPKETYQDGHVVEVYRRMYYFFLKIGALPDDD